MEGPSPEYRPAFELAAKLGALQDASQTEAIITTILQVRGVQQRLWAATIEGEDGINVKQFVGTGMPATAICDALDTSLDGAGLLENLIDRLYEEEVSSQVPTPLSDQLTAEQQAPMAGRRLLQRARTHILEDTQDVIILFSDMLTSLMAVKRGFKPSERHMIRRSVEMTTSSLMNDGTTRIEEAETLLQLVQNPAFIDVPDIDVNGLSARDLFMRLARIYRQWRTRRNHHMPDGAFAGMSQQSEADQVAVAENEPADLPTAVPENTAPSLETTKSELIRLIGLHATHAKRYRPSWSQLKVAFRNLELAMRRTPLESKQAHADLDYAPHRLIGLMAVLAIQGSGPDQNLEAKQAELHKRLTSFFTFEQAIGVNIRTEQWTLREAGADIDIGDWVPVEDDFTILRDVWPKVQPLVITHWPRGAGRGAVAAITNSLGAFDAYHRAIADPEQYLKTIATHLGATALRPETRPEKSSETRVIRESEIELAAAQRHRAVRDVLEGIINNESLQKNDRQRAEVLKYFLIGPNKPQLPLEGVYPGFFYLEPSEVQPTLYFGVIFQSPNGSEWILIESLRYGKASYAFSKKLIEQEGEGVSLEDFLNIYNKAELVRKGAIKVVHIENWTPESHIALTKKYIARAEAHAAQNSF